MSDKKKPLAKTDDQPIMETGTFKKNQKKLDSLIEQGNKPVKKKRKAKSNG